MRVLAAPILLCAACQPDEGVLLLRAEPDTCRREPASAVRLTLLGDFPPITVGAGVGSPTQRLSSQEARSVAIEGLSARGVTALGWSGPLPVAVPGQERVVPVLYGAPDSLCQVRGLRRPRAFHRVTLMDGGQALITGGLTTEGPTDTLERYSTTTAEIFAVQPLYEGAAIGHTATLLPDGTVLVAGGARPDAATADPARERARIYRLDGEPQGGVLLLEGGRRALHAALRLPDGQVWLSGGCAAVAPLLPDQPPTCAPGDVLDSSVRYDRAGNFVPGPKLSRPRFGHQVFALPSGRVLLVGGTGVDGMGGLAPAAEAEVVDALAGPGVPAAVVAGQASGAATPLPGGGVLWSDAALAARGGVLLPGEGGAVVSALRPRHHGSLSPLPDGAALLAGGLDSAGAIEPTLEIYEFGRYRVLPDPLPRLGHSTLPLPDGTVLLAGGLQPGGTAGAPTTSVLRFVHELRIADATPPPWPVEAEEGRRWLVPRRPDRASFDGQTLQVNATAPGAGGRPGETVLLGGVTWAGGELAVEVAAGEPAGAALVLGHQHEAGYHFVRLTLGQPVGLWRVDGERTEEVAGCRGATLTGELPIAVQVLLGEGLLVVKAGGSERLRCAADIPRSALGLGSLGGGVAFRGLSVVRGR